MVLMLVGRQAVAMFTLHCLGGLCNRLQAVLSYRSLHRPLIVEWSDLVQAGGHFLDAFEPLEGVEFRDGPNWPVTHHGGQMTIGEVVADNGWCPGAPKAWLNTYRDLKLRPHLRERLIKPPYSAIHVRRTDHIPFAMGMGKLTVDAEFRAWCDYTPGPIFIATDNGTTQREFVSYLGERAIIQAPIPEHANQNLHDHRNTDIGSAAVDLFICAGAEKFKGTPLSSFSRTIEHLHQLGVT